MEIHAPGTGRLSNQHQSRIPSPPSIVSPNDFTWSVANFTSQFIIGGKVFRSVCQMNSALLGNTLSSLSMTHRYCPQYEAGAVAEHIKLLPVIST